MAPTAPLGDQIPIVGREREQEQLRSCFRHALAGRGTLVLLSGEAGIGKTTLVRDLIRQAEEQGALVLSGGCYDLTTTPPYGPWLEAVGRYAPLARDPATPSWLSDPAQMANSGSQAELFEAARSFLTGIAAQRALVIVLEDLHWSDPASLDALHYLARTLNETATLLVVTYRDDEVARSHPLFQLLPALVRETRVERIRLGRLDDQAVQTLIAAGYALSDDDLLRLTTYVSGLAEGNPLFTVELLRALEDEGLIRVDTRQIGIGDLNTVTVSTLIEQVIERRLDRVDERTRDVLQVAAVIGQELSIDLWQAVSGLAGEDLDRVAQDALTAHVLEELPDHSAFRFTHALVREVLYSGIVLPQRRHLHRAIAEVLAATPQADPDAVAYHYQQAGDERAIEWLLRAGLRARRSAAWFTAAERFDTAAAMLEGNTTVVGARAWLLFYVAFLRRFSTRPENSEYLDEAERLAAAANDQVLAAYIQHIRGTFRCMRGDIRRGLANIQAGVAALEELSHTYDIPAIDVKATAEIEGLLPTISAEPHSVNPSQPGPASASPGVIQQRAVLVSWLAHVGNYREARVQAEAYTAQAGDPRQRFGRWQGGGDAYAAFALGHTYAALGFPDDAQSAYTLAREGFAAHGDYSMEEDAAWAELLMVTLPYQTDRTLERTRLLSIGELAWKRAVGAALKAIHPTHCRLLIDILEGRWIEARQLADEGRSNPNVNKFHGAMVSLGVLARNQGESDLAWQQVHKLLPEGPDTEPGDSYFPHAHAAQRLAVELALDASDLGMAHAWIEAHARWLEWSGALLWRPHHQLLWARYHRLTGDLDRVRRHAARALEHASDPRQPLALVAAARVLGELDTHDKRFVEAEEHLRRSLALAQACAAPFEQALTLLALAELGVATGSGEEARSLLGQARKICEPLDAKPALARADEIEQRLDRTRSGTSFPAGLSPREVDVLRLVAQGLTDAEIAEQLFLSPRTVSSYLSSVYNKLGVNSRTAAAAFAIREGIA